jgi:hypothetical protein
MIAVNPGWAGFSGCARGATQLLPLVVGRVRPRIAADLSSLWRRDDGDFLPRQATAEQLTIGTVGSAIDIRCGGCRSSRACVVVGVHFRPGGALADHARRSRLACGYFDQSHLINDVREFTGTTPVGLLRTTEQFEDLHLTV